MRFGPRLAHAELAGGDDVDDAVGVAERERIDGKVAGLQNREIAVVVLVRIHPEILAQKLPQHRRHLQRRDAIGAADQEMEEHPRARAPQDFEACCEEARIEFHQRGADGDVHRARSSDSGLRRARRRFGQQGRRAIGHAVGRQRDDAFLETGGIADEVLFQHDTVHRLGKGRCGVAGRHQLDRRQPQIGEPHRQAEHADAGHVTDLRVLRFGDGADRRDLVQRRGGGEFDMFVEDLLRDVVDISGQRNADNVKMPPRRFQGERMRAVDRMVGGEPFDDDKHYRLARTRAPRRGASVLDAGLGEFAADQAVDRTLDRVFVGAVGVAAVHVDIVQDGVREDVEIAEAVEMSGQPAQQPLAPRMRGRRDETALRDQRHAETGGELRRRARQRRQIEFDFRIRRIEQKQLEQIGGGEYEAAAHRRGAELAQHVIGVSQRRAGEQDADPALQPQNAGLDIGGQPEAGIGPQAGDRIGDARHDMFAKLLLARAFPGRSLQAALEGAVMRLEFLQQREEIVRRLGNPPSIGVALELFEVEGHGRSRRAPRRRIAGGRLGEGESRVAPGLASATSERRPGNMA